MIELILFPRTKGQKSLYDYYKNTDSTKCSSPSKIKAELRAYQLQLMRYATAKIIIVLCRVTIFHKSALQ